MSYCIDCGATTQKKIPDGDNRERMVCSDCGAIHYQNPKIVVGCIPEIDDSILLCRRAIEPRYGFWTVPAGFMELGETLIEGAIRETKEEAGASVEIGHLFASVDVIGAGQIHVFFTAKLLGDFSAGQESLEVQLFKKNKIPWEELAFQSGIFALKKYLEDQGRNNGIHYHTLVHKKS
jgi:ADP-ribose pyrophosphatase YjhB (NUDIX family)